MPIEFESDELSYDRIYRGVVVDNVDPSKFGRVKINIFGMYDGISVSNIPWAAPAFPVGFGAGNGYGQFSVPEIGSMVFCFFEQGDIYQPVYFASAPDGIHGLPTERTTNYPNRAVIKTPNGIVIYIDDEAKVVRVNHPSGKYIQMDGSGNVTISAGNVTIQASGEIDVSASGNITISGSQVDINP